MKDAFVENPLVLIFTVAAIGYLVGKVQFKGISLGVAAVLFVGLFFGAVLPAVELPEVLFQLGLVFFVYSVGVSSGSAFFKSIQINGSRDILFGLLMLTISAILAVGIYFIFGLDKSTVTGIYSGSTTNTPALAATIEQILQSPKLINKDDLVNSAVVAYSFTYPIGVISPILGIILMEKILKVDYKKEARELKKTYPVGSDLTSMTLKVTQEAATNTTMRDLFNEHDWNVVFGRLSPREGDIELPHWDTRFQLDDEVMVVGTREDLQNVIDFMGEKVDSKLSHNRNEFDVRNIFVSNPFVVGKKLSELNLNQKFNTIITRIRRGDVDMLANGNTVLELGDRIRFIARRKDLKALSTFFGDSYYASSRINLLSFGLGIALGLLLGAIEFSLPGGLQFKLGFAGGPLIVALILGALQRTGPIVWTLPYSVNVTLKQIGLIILLATIGLKSGPAFVSALSSGGISVFIGGVVISLLTSILTILIGYKLVKIPFTFLTGIIANQPAILEFAVNRVKNNLPVIAYTLIFPISMIIKIVYAQLLFLFLP